MDGYLKWEQLTITKQLNCICNMLAKNSITTAIIQGYHNRQSQLLANKDVALIIWGNKIIGNTSSPLRFHASKEVPRKYLANCKKDKWSNKNFNAVDWEHWELALKNKRWICTGYGGLSKIWASAVQGSRSAVTPVIWFPTSNAQTAEYAKLQHTSCSTRMTTTLGYWSKMLMN
jgi:hypothetical protein